MADLNMQYGQFGVAPGFQLGDLGGGAMSGSAGMDMLRNYRGNSNMQSLMNNLIMAANQEKMNTYGLDAPVREAQRGANIATSRATENTIEGQKQSELNKLQEDVARLQGTRVTDIEAKNEANKESVSKVRDAQYMRLFDEFTAASSQWQGMEGLQQAKDWMDEKSIPQNHPMRQMIKSGSTPETFQAGLLRAQQGMANNVASIRSRAEAAATAGFKGQEDRLTQKVIGDWHIEVAKINAAAAKGTASKQDVENLLSESARNLQNAIKAGDTDAIQFWTSEVNKLARLAAELSAAKVPPQILPGPSGLQQRPQMPNITPVGTPTGTPRPAGARPPLTNFERR